MCRQDFGSLGLPTSTRNSCANVRRRPFQNVSRVLEKSWEWCQDVSSYVATSAGTWHPIMCSFGGCFALSRRYHQRDAWWPLQGGLAVNIQCDSQINQRCVILRTSGDSADFTSYIWQFGVSGFRCTENVIIRTNCACRSLRIALFWKMILRYFKIFQAIFVHCFGLAVHVTVWVWVGVLKLKRCIKSFPLFPVSNVLLACWISMGVLGL
jgi:hypothetical protein